MKTYFTICFLTLTTKHAATSESLTRKILLPFIIVVASLTTMGQAVSTSTAHLDRTVGSSSISRCRGANLTVKQIDTDAAMGGVRTEDYSVTNSSSATCTLQGYPRFELLDRHGRRVPNGLAVNSTHLPGDESRKPAKLVSIEAGGDAWFRIYYNSGGAGYSGRPCPVGRKAKITLPGTSKTFVVTDEVTFCADLRTSAIRDGKRR